MHLNMEALIKQDLHILLNIVSKRTLLIKM